MEHQFEISLGQKDKLVVDRLTTEDIEVFLNQGQNEYIIDRLANNKVNISGSGNTLDDVTFDLSRKGLEDLRYLVKIISGIAPDSDVNNPSTIPNSKYFSINVPTDYLLFSHVLAKVTRNSITDTIGTKLIPYNQVNKFIKTKFNNPNIREPYVCLFESNSLLVIHNEKDTVNSIEYWYVRQPKQITKETIGTTQKPATEWTNTPELPVYAHTDIVRKAVRAASIVFDIENYQAQSIEEKDQVNRR